MMTLGAFRDGCDRSAIARETENAIVELKARSLE